MSKASELAGRLEEPARDCCSQRTEAAVLLRKQEAVIRQMREALWEAQPYMVETSYRGSKAYEGTNLAIAAADEVLK